jgi:hypothetical protein
MSDHVMQARAIIESFVSSSHTFDFSFTMEHGARYHIKTDVCEDGTIIVLNVFGVPEPFGFMKFSGSVKGPFGLN